MAALLAGLRANPVKSAAGLDVVGITDYKNDDTGLPKSDVLSYKLSDGKSYFIIRPSGTEPKIKLYLGTAAESFDAAEGVIDKVLADVRAQLNI